MHKTKSVSTNQFLQSEQKTKKTMDGVVSAF